MCDAAIPLREVQALQGEELWYQLQQWNLQQVEELMVMLDWLELPPDTVVDPMRLVLFEELWGDDDDDDGEWVLF